MFVTNPLPMGYGNITNFDTRPGFNLNYTTSNASARLGWICAIKDFDANRRRVINT